MKKYSILIITLLSLAWLNGVSLQECLLNLRRQTPLAENLILAEEQKLMTNKKLKANYLPMVFLTADAGWNSEVTQIDLGSGAPFSPPAPDKDRESVGLEVKQLVWNGGINSLMRETNDLETRARILETKSAIHEREIELVNLYYQILSLNESIAIAELQRANQNNRLKQVEASLQSGIREYTDVQLVRLDVLAINDKITVLNHAKEAAIKQLSRLCGLEVSAGAEFTMPVFDVVSSDEIARYELQRLETLASMHRLKSRLATRKNYPSIAARASISYGKPGFDLFSTEFHEYYSVGVNLSWKIWDFNQRNQEKRIALNEAKILESNKANLLITINNEILNVDSEIESTHSQIQNSLERVELLEGIVSVFENKYDAGMITTNELLIQTNNLLSAQMELQKSRIRLSAFQAKKILLMGGKI